MGGVRPPAVAGVFYPDSPTELRATIGQLLAAVPRADAARPCPKALIVPHAGYVYSGATAAAAFARIAPFADRIERVVLVGPAHRVYVSGLAAPGVAHLATPLGELAVDVEMIAKLPNVGANAAAHAREHSIEVMLPFLQQLVPHAKLVPVIGCDASGERVAHVLEAVWGGPETVIIISSDLSHYAPYDEGRLHDEQTVARILSLAGDVDGDDACGAVGINGLVHLAKRKHLRGELVKLCSSGDRPGGDRSSVVGYAAIAFYEEP